MENNEEPIVVRDETVVEEEQVKEVEEDEQIIVEEVTLIEESTEPEEPRTIENFEELIKNDEEVSLTNKVCDEILITSRYIINNILACAH